jgi:hypothetical protein
MSSWRKRPHPHRRRKQRAGLQLPRITYSSIPPGIPRNLYPAGWIPKSPKVTYFGVLALLLALIGVVCAIFLVSLLIGLLH